MRVRIIGDRDFVARKNSLVANHDILFFIMFNLVLYFIRIPATFCA